MEGKINSSLLLHGPSSMKASRSQTNCLYKVKWYCIQNQGETQVEREWLTQERQHKCLDFLVYLTHPLIRIESLYYFSSILMRSKRKNWRNLLVGTILSTGLWNILWPFWGPKWLFLGVKFSLLIVWHRDTILHSKTFPASPYGKNGSIIRQPWNSLEMLVQC